MKYKNLIVATIDILLLNVCYLIAFYLRFMGSIPKVNFSPYMIMWPIISLVGLILLFSYGLYNTHKKTWSEVFYSVVCSVGLLAVFSMALVYFLGEFAFPRSVFIIGSVLQLMSLIAARFVIWKYEKISNGKIKVILIGELKEITELIRKKEDQGLDYYNIEGIVLPESRIGGDEKVSYKILGEYNEVESIIKNYKPDELIICNGVKHEEKAFMLNLCIENNVSFCFVPDIYDIFLSEITLEQVDDVPIFKVKKLNIDAEHRFIKRIFDIFLSVGILLLTLPLMIMVALLIKIDSKGPVFYSQKRISENGKRFNLFKFRTMVENAENTSGPVLADKNDNRVTRLGGFLRATRVDEIPQVLNVLLGDMSLVGPRPERPFFVEQYKKTIPEYDYRLKIKSGITGLAQVNGKYSTTPLDKLRYDLLYVKKRSILYDIHILLQTIKTVLMKDKAS